MLQDGIDEGVAELRLFLRLRGFEAKPALERWWRGRRRHRCRRRVPRLGGGPQPYDGEDDRSGERGGRRNPAENALEACAHGRRVARRSVAPERPG